MHMHSYLIALTAAIIIFLFPQSAMTAIDDTEHNDLSTNLELPSALTDDDSFDDLPFEQLRQALREEVEYGPKKGVSPRSFQKYNLLIR